jgi:hypothetical protein
MSVKQYAEHRGCQIRAVSVAIAKGRISRSADGWIDSDQADKDWAANTNPRMSDANKRNGAIGQAMKRRRVPKPPTRIEPDQPMPVHAPPDDIGQLAAARSVRERFAALLLKLDYEERTGKLINKDEVTTTAYQMHRMLRDSILAIPDRIAAQLAAEDDAAEVHRMLEAELRTVLEKVASMRGAGHRRERERMQYGNVG